MIRRILPTFVAVLWLLLISSQQSQASAAKSYSADAFNVSASIASGGTMDVTEIVTFRFAGGPFTFVSRQIPTNNTDGISIISAGMDNQTMGEGHEAGQYEIKSGNPISITWHFSPTSDSTHTFTLNYHIQGIIQKSSTDSTDLLDWIPLPTSHDYSIATSIVTITYPSSTALVSAPEVAYGRATVSQSEGQVQFRSTDLEANAYLEIGLRFHPGSLISTAPNWQRMQQLSWTLLPYLLISSIAIFIAGSLFLPFRYRQYRRRISARLLASLQITAPPSDFPPAIAGALATTSNGSPSWDHALGTLFDLINREIITVIPPLQGGWSSWLHGQPDFQLALVSLPDDLRPHEAGLLKMLFNTGQGVQPTVMISKISYIYRNQFGSFSGPLQQEMAELGFFDPERQRVRKRLGYISFLILFLSILVLIAFSVFAILNWLPWPLIFLPLGVLGVGITAIVLWITFSTYTDDTMQLKIQWQAFLNFMRSLTRMKQPDLAPQLLAQYLPYSASFGLLIPWAKTLERQGITALPNWFKRLVTADHPNSSRRHTHAFAGMVQTTHKHTHKSESSSGSGTSHVSGSSGAAGGGSSGAG